MRYELKSGYIYKVFFGCHSGSCKLYSGTIPSGYDSLEDWADNANIRAYKIVNGNLTYDSAKDATLQKEYDELAKTYSTVEKKIGTWTDGKPLYRKVITTTKSFSNTTMTVAHGVTNMDRMFVENAYFYNASSGISYPVSMVGYGGTYTDKTYIWVDRTNINIATNGGWGTGWEKVITLLYTKEGE